MRERKREKERVKEREKERERERKERECANIFFMRIFWGSCKWSANVARTKL